MTQTQGTGNGKQITALGYRRYRVVGAALELLQPRCTLLRCHVGVYLRLMTASEVIEQIKALPQHGKDEVAEFVQRMQRERLETPSAAEETTEPAVHYVDNKTFREAAERVFAQHSELLAKLAK